MRQNRVKKVMRAGQLAIGASVGLADPQMVEIIGLAGFDAAFIDMEHSGFDLPLVAEMIRAADLAGVTSMVRVPDNDPKLILRLLDMGAEGIVVPHVDGVRGARRAVAAVRYPPLGERGGVAISRAARFGDVPWDQHVRQSNEEVLLSVMAEDEKAIAEVEQIASLEGVDLISIGPTDLSQALGIREPADRRLTAKVEEVAQIVRRSGGARLSIPMNHPMLPLTPGELMALGAGYSNVGPAAPAILLQAMREKVHGVHRATGRPGQIRADAG